MIKYTSIVEQEAHEFAENFLPNPYQAQTIDDYAEAYAAGARCVLKHLEQFAARVNKIKPYDSSTEFEQGQVDGVLWSLDIANILFGVDR